MPRNSVIRLRMSPIFRELGRGDRTRSVSSHSKNPEYESVHQYCFKWIGWTELRIAKQEVPHSCCRGLCASDLYFSDHRREPSRLIPGTPPPRSHGRPSRPSERSILSHRSKISGRWRRCVTNAGNCSASAHSYPAPLEGHVARRLCRSLAAARGRRHLQRAVLHRARPLAGPDSDTLPRRGLRREEAGRNPIAACVSRHA
jgi:hypothetical protein